MGALSTEAEDSEASAPGEGVGPAGLGEAEMVRVRAAQLAQ